MLPLKYKLVLGSQSPRRYELLSGLDVDFVVRTPLHSDENYPLTLAASEVPLFLAKQKSLALMNTLTTDELLLTADTVVVLENGEILGKPSDRSEAMQMLQRLSGGRHTVISGVAFSLYDGIHFADAISSEVYFATLSNDEIAYYLDHYHPYDKAGAYGIQEWIGYIGITKIEGSFYNVMGLPIQLIYKTLRDWHLYEKNIVPL